MIEPRIGDFLDELQPIAAEISVDAAWALSRHFRKTRVYIPKRWHEGLDLNVIGADAARALCELFGPERIDVPEIPFTPAALRRFVVDARKSGVPNGKIGLALGISHRTVTRLAAGARVLTSRRGRVNDSRQIDLVDWLGDRKSSD